MQYLILCLTFLFSSTLWATPDDERFLAVRDAYRAGAKDRFERQAAGLQDYELAPYIDYWRLLLNMNTTNSDAPAPFMDFLQRNEASYIAEKLRSDWLKKLAKKGQWEWFDREYPRIQQPDQEIACYALQRRIALHDKQALDIAQTLWLTLMDVPDACATVFNTLATEKRISIDELWARVRRLCDANKLSAARQTLRYLPQAQQADPATITAVIDKPLPWLVKGAFKGKERTSRELAALAISRIARNDPRMAAEQLEKIRADLHDNERSWAWGQIGWQAAQRQIPDALTWYQAATNTTLSDEALQWKVRAALRAQNWKIVRTSIESMRSDLAEQASWVYWLARAKQAEGHSAEAQALYVKLSGQPNFYGNLADAELKRPVTVPPKAAAPTPEEMAAVSNNPSFKRALALLRVDLRTEGVREWAWGLRNMSDRELLASAHFAVQAGVYDRAIAAADRTKVEHDYSLRYLAPFSAEVRQAARQQSLDEAWVYGLMRQESRFVTQAKSSVGASGLMQLMPATARWVAKKIGLNDYKHSKVNDPETNLLLGTSYMRLVLESLDNHPVLTSAAYNAGPGRARRWRDAQPMDAAIYAESIPFNETRDYVKKVISNSVYYSVLFTGQPHSIKEWLAPIGAPKPIDPKAADLP